MSAQALINQAGTEAWRTPALNLLATQGLPTSKHEAWHYSNLAAFVQNGVKAAPIPTTKPNPLMLPWVLNGGRKFVLINGHVALGASALMHDGSKVDFVADDALLALNMALTKGGVYMVASQADEMLEIAYISQKIEAQTSLASPNTIIEVQDGASLTLVERFSGDTPDAMLTNHALQIKLGAGASLRHLRLVEGGIGHALMTNTHINMADDASYDMHFTHNAPANIRQNITASLHGAHATCNIAGVQLMDDYNSADSNILINHLAPHTTSTQTIRNVADGHATTSWQGKVYVDKDAQKTDANQQSKSILLSRHATVNTKPELEIYADDVACAHGATTGALDAEALFYMRARGVPEADARQLLLEAFIAEAFDTAPLVLQTAALDSLCLATHKDDQP